ncbi:alpha-L-arabinofuranosidase, partial [Bacteroides sp. OttesenSCG-928-J23]|nr:alpha-L-arabinofuranosidase [Bacteroides sp. OttesenSCG-928-J23]
DGWQWRPDMIWFDNLASVRTVSYYVQQLYAMNKGSHTLPLTMNKQNVTGADGQNGLFASAVWEQADNTYIVKVVNTSAQAQSITLKFEGMKKTDYLTDGVCVKLQSTDLYAENTVDVPNTVLPRESKVFIDGNSFTAQLEAHTFALYRFRKSTK